MLSFCIGSISWYCFVVPVFHCSSSISLFRGAPIVLPVFCCSANVPVFRRCSAFRSPVFRCSWFYSLPRESPKFNSHHLQKIYTGFKMAVLTPKSGIEATYRLVILKCWSKTGESTIIRKIKHIYVLPSSVNLTFNK